MEFLEFLEFVVTVVRFGTRHVEVEVCTQTQKPTLCNFMLNQKERKLKYGSSADSKVTAAENTKAIFLKVSSTRRPFKPSKIVAVAEKINAASFMKLALLLL